MMTMMDNDGNEGNDDIEDIDVFNTCISFYLNLTPVLMHWHRTHKRKQYSLKPVLLTGTMKEGTHCNEEGKNK